MIDIHTHILPCMDDGAQDVATSLALLQMEWEQGVREVVLTSHYYGKTRSPAQFIEARAQALEGLREGIPEGLSVRLGAEVYFTGSTTPSFEELSKLAIEGTNYILIEFPFVTAWPQTLLEQLSAFIAETGYTPIIAHVERYPAVRKDPRVVAKLVDMGCLIQVNAEAFLNRREQGLAFALLKNGLAHCIGTDTHNLKNRLPRYAEAREMVKNRDLLRDWNAAQWVMERVLAGGQVCVEYRKPVKKLFGKYF